MRSPLRLKPFRVTGWDVGQKILYEGYTWKGKIVGARRLNQYPLFWNAAHAALSYGTTLAAYVATYAVSAPDLANHFIRHPRAVCWYETDVNIRAAVTSIASTLLRHGIFAGPIGGFYEGNLGVFGAAGPTDDIVEVTDSPDGPRQVRNIIRQPVCGEVLYLHQASIDSAFTYTIDDSGTYIPRSNLMSQHVAFLNESTGLHERVKYYTIAFQEGDPGEPSALANIAAVVAQIPDAEVYTTPSADPADYQSRFLGQVTSFFNL